MEQPKFVMFYAIFLHPTCTHENGKETKLPSPPLLSLHLWCHPYLCFMLWMD